MAGGIFAVLLILAVISPQASHVLFGWLPATISVFTGVSVPGDVRLISNEQTQAVLTQLDGPVRESMVAQAQDAYDAIVTQPSVADRMDSILESLWSTFVPFSVFASLLFAMGFMYAYFRLKQVKEFEKKRFKVAHAGATTATGPNKMQARWQRIVEYANTTNENDWRHAILDADVMLDELLEAQGYRGDTMGDKLKQVERSDFKTIDLAWEAHKVRNKIAHEGSALSLNEREIRRVVALFEQVFKEFHLI